MAYLKGVRCENCRDKIRILQFHDKQDGKLYVDGAECKTCFKRIILPDEEFTPFVREFGER